MDGLCQASVEAANNDLEGTAALCEQYGVVAKAALAQKALPQCNIVFETGDEMKTTLRPTSMSCMPLIPPAWAGACLRMTSTMSAKLNLHAHCRGRCKHPPFERRYGKGRCNPHMDCDLAACRCGAGAWRAVSGHAPSRHWGRWQQLAPTAAFWQRIVFQRAAYIGGLSAGSSGRFAARCSRGALALGAVFIDPAMQLIRAMPVASFVILALLWVRSANLSVIVSFTHVLPVVYAGVLAGIADTDTKLLEMAHVYRLPLITSGCGISGCPASSRPSVKAASPPLGMCWKSGVSAEVIGLPDRSVGDALYRAKITLSTPDVFAWTLVIVLLSAALSAAAARLLRTAKMRLCGRCTGMSIVIRSLWQTLWRYACSAGFYMDGRWY